MPQAKTKTMANRPSLLNNPFAYIDSLLRAANPNGPVSTCADLPRFGLAPNKGLECIDTANGFRLSPLPSSASASVSPITNPNTNPILLLTTRDRTPGSNDIAGSAKSIRTIVIVFVSLGALMCTVIVLVKVWYRYRDERKQLQAAGRPRSSSSKRNWWFSWRG